MGDGVSILGCKGIVMEIAYMNAEEGMIQIEFQSAVARSVKG